MKKLLIKNVLFITLAIALLGCGGSENTSKQNTNDQEIQIAVIPKGTTHAFWKSVQLGAEKAGQDLGVKVLWQGPQKEDDRQMQIQVVQNFVSRGVSAIVLAPLDSRSLVPPVQTAIKRNIPVIIFDSGLDAQEYSSFVATDNKEGGRLCAKRMAEVMNGKGKIILLRYAEGSASTTEREAGFLEGLKEFAPEIEILSDNQYAGATREEAFQTSQNLLNRFKEVEGIFAPNESSTFGMLRALETSGKAGKVKFIGFDATKELLDAMQAGKIHGLSVQNPYKMGYEGVKTALAVLKKETVEKRIDTGVTMITPENLNTSEVQEILKPQIQ
ncbi:ABC transporter substrate-binding protein [Thermoflexibacter ruber]|uniref:Monosaccharide ABC transporter substrate-binding protein, CUT2 family n=1 Tax=Thermoflexibacter ruber TaxID=1003 RepID=A0A1I2EJ35_9BACT|nr:substrate-binding domain-containing protein [Thermoflexibacter ruber]SFE92536.1 monosaccharide ABC transporter substrate-binding protein, CUT2 family [Thermoflexibacter ruber]